MPKSGAFSILVHAPAAVTGGWAAHHQRVRPCARDLERPRASGCEWWVGPADNVAAPACAVCCWCGLLCAVCSCGRLQPGMNHLSFVCITVRSSACAALLWLTGLFIMFQWPLHLSTHLLYTCCRFLHVYCTPVVQVRDDPAAPSALRAAGVVGADAVVLQPPAGWSPADEDANVSHSIPHTITGSLAGSVRAVYSTIKVVLPHAVG